MMYLPMRCLYHEMPAYEMLAHEMLVRKALAYVPVHEVLAA